MAACFTSLISLASGLNTSLLSCIVHCKHPGFRYLVRASTKGITSTAVSLSLERFDILRIYSSIYKLYTILRFICKELKKTFKDI